jgi:hypothetical protein
VARITKRKGREASSKGAEFLSVCFGLVQPHDKLAGDWQRLELDLESLAVRVRERDANANLV